MFLLAGCTTIQKPDNTISGGEPKSIITNPNHLETTIYPLPEKPELLVLQINENALLAQHTKNITVLYSTSNFKDFAVQSKIPGVQGNYYSAPDNSEMIFCFSFASQGQTGIWKSEDSGKNWRRTFMEPVNFMAFHPCQTTRIYALRQTHNARAKIYVSNDQGENWVQHSEIAGAYLVSEIAINPKNPEQILAASRNGLWLTSDNGDHWINLFAQSDLTIGEPNHVVYNPVDLDEAYFIGHGRVFRLSLSDGVITAVDYNGEYGAVSSLVFRPGTGTAYFISELQDNIQFYQVENGIVQLLSSIDKATVGYLFKLLFDSSNPNILYAIGYQNLVKLSLS